ncbi:uncharacterized protein LOC105665321 [Ceratitis capitata]|uniref:uncharacterized protein LOC105665321 n=1 Tax=Ceratitis capitata TaxID=7213 RepID=UPI000618887E|nr:uncharacterized protein LOC105665321 [Ceratitis capitata]
MWLAFLCRPNQRRQHGHCHQMQLPESHVSCCFAMVSQRSTTKSAAATVAEIVQAQFTTGTNANPSTSPPEAVKGTKPKRDRKTRATTAATAAAAATSWLCRAHTLQRRNLA